MSETGTELKHRKNIFIDSAPLIYYIEKSETYFSLLEPLFQNNAAGEFQFLTSTLTLIEVLTQPIRLKRYDLVQQYEEILMNSPFLRLVTSDLSIARTAAHLRAEHNVKTPDAIQLASAINSNASVFITNDKELKRVPGMTILVMEDLQNSSYRFN